MLFRSHSWLDHDSETLGILYACRAGFLDLVHIRNAADWTLNLQTRLLRALRRGEPGLDVEGADRGVRLHIAFPAALTPEQRARRPDGDFPVVWAKTYGKGRVYMSAFGHKKGCKKAAIGGLPGTNGCGGLLGANTAANAN